MKEVLYYNIDSIQTLRDAWINLEKGADMTYYQTYSWYEMLTKVYKDKKFSFEICFAVVYDEKIPKIIAPLIAYRKSYRFVNRKGIYFFGRKGWSDYLNLIYDDFNEDLVCFLLHEIREYFEVDKCYFEQIKVDTKFYNYLKRNNLIFNETLTDCVSLSLPKSKEEYNALLSKHARQNLRTANNRVEKAGLNFKVNFDDKFVDKNVCREMREKRVVDKKKKFYNSMSMFEKIKYRLYLSLEEHYPEFVPFYEDMNSKMLTSYDGDTLCSFFNYGIDHLHNTIVLMAVGTNENYAKYSPGMISLYSFICSNIENGDIEYFDFTRGDEPYKFTLGGKKDMIADVVVHFV